jgi:large-conductance mechanosensitive channel
LGILFSSVLCTCPNQQSMQPYCFCYGRFLKNCINFFIIYLGLCLQN